MQTAVFFFLWLFSSFPETCLGVINAPRIESSPAQSNGKCTRPLTRRVSQVIAGDSCKQDRMMEKTACAVRNETTLSLSDNGGNKFGVYFASRMFLFVPSHTLQAYLLACLPCLSYCTAMSTFWVTALIVPAHAFSADSIIRHSGHPEKKKEAGKRGMRAESMGEFERWQWWEVRRGLKRSEMRKGIVERKERKKRGWVLGTSKRRAKLERERERAWVSVLPRVIYLCWGKSAH